MNKTNILAAAMGVIVTTAVVAGITYAYQGNSANFMFKFKGPLDENHQALIEAVENKDYAGWKKIMDEQIAKMSEFITEENFNRMVAMHEAMEAGDMEAVKSLHEELGMPAFGFGPMGGKMHVTRGGFGHGMGITPEQHEEIRTAIENNDYEAWKGLMGDNPVAEKITAENFSKLTESHKLMQEGKFEEAKEIREELGLNFGKGMMGRFQKAQ